MALSAAAPASRSLAHPAVAGGLLPGLLKRSVEPAGIEYKAIPCEIKADRGKRRVELYIAAYDNVDLGGDKMVFGCAATSIREDLPRKAIKFLADHKEPLGPCEVLEEHASGLFMVGKVTDHPDLDRKLAQIADGTYAHGSLGYTPRAGGYAIEVQPNGSKVRVLTDVRVYEGSVVLWPMNELAEVTGIKSKAGVMETKDLYDFSDAIMYLHRLRWLASSEWAKLSAEEAEQAQALLELMTDKTKELSAGVQITLAAKRAAGPFETKGSGGPIDIKSLIDSAASRRAAIEQLIQGGSR